MTDRSQVTPERRRIDRKRAIAVLGRPLLRSQPIHHHSLTQIVICESDNYHRLLHRRERVLKAHGNPNTDEICPYCHNPRPAIGFKGWQCEYCYLADRLWWALARVDCSVYRALDERTPPIGPEATWGGKTAAELGEKTVFDVNRETRLLHLATEGW